MRKAYNFKRLTEMVKHFAVLMLITVMAAGNLFADEVTFVFSEAGVANGQLLPDGTLNGIISYSGEKQSSSNDGPKYYTSGSALRFYAGANSTLGNALVLTPAFGYQITGLTINALNTYTPEVGQQSEVLQCRNSAVACYLYYNHLHHNGGSRCGCSGLQPSVRCVYHSFLCFSDLLHSGCEYPLQIQRFIVLCAFRIPCFG